MARACHTAILLAARDALKCTMLHRVKAYDGCPCLRDTSHLVAQLLDLLECQLI